MTAAAALPPAVLTVRFPGWLSGLLERTAYVGFAVPRIAIALGLVFFGAAFARPLYQTTAMLVLAYAILFLPTALASLSAALHQVPPHLEEAARGLGRTPWGTFTGGDAADHLAGCAGGAGARVPADHGGVARNADLAPRRVRHPRQLRVVGDQ